MLLLKATLRNEVQHHHIQDAELRRKAQQQGVTGDAFGGDGQQQQQDTVLLGPFRQKIRSRFWKAKGMDPCRAGIDAVAMVVCMDSSAHS